MKDANGYPVQGIWRHFKTNPDGTPKDYLVLGVTFSPEDRSVLVRYEPLYGENRLQFSRPLDQWFDHIERDGYSGPRFRFVETSSGLQEHRVFLRHSDQVLTQLPDGSWLLSVRSPQPGFKEWADRQIQRIRRALEG